MRAAFCKCMTWRLWLKWQDSLEKYGVKINVKKTDTMVCSKTGKKQLNMKDVQGEELKHQKF